MPIFSSRNAPILVIILFLAATAASVFTISRMPATEKVETLAEEQLTILTPKGETHIFTVEVASTPAAQEKGLMFRTSLEPDRGMLFVFPTPELRAFWMKNTLIPLDMIFITAANEVNYIVTATPHDLTPQGPDTPVIAVLELNAGRAAALGITTGSKIASPSLKNLTQPK